MTNKILDRFLSVASLVDLGVVKTGNIPAKAYTPIIDFPSRASPLSVLEIKF